MTRPEGTPHHRASEDTEGTERHLNRKRDGGWATAVGWAMPTVFFASSADFADLRRYPAAGRNQDYLSQSREGRKGKHQSSMEPRPQVGLWLIAHHLSLCCRRANRQSSFIDNQCKGLSLACNQQCNRPPEKEPDTFNSPLVLCIFPLPRPCAGVSLSLQ